jgi:hypothetical protein
MQQQSFAFLSVDNLKLCIDVFQDYMTDKYAINIKARDPEYKKTIYKVMVETSKVHPPSEMLSRRDMNNLFLNASRDHYLRAFNMDKSSSRTRLKGDVGLYEGRKAMPPMARAMPQQLGQLPSIGHLPGPPTPAPAPTAEEPFKETAFDPSEFDRKMIALRDMRGTDKEDATLVDEKAKAVVADALKLSLEPVASNEGSGGAAPVSQLAVASLDMAQFVAPPAASTYVTERYLIVNGFDRDWSLNKQRFRVVADFGAMSGNDLQQRYKNIRSISIKRAIIPQEISDTPNLSHPGKTIYNHAFSFSMPYVLIAIDEIQSVFDGTNDTVRRSFCQMIVDKHYRAANGRGFFVLQAMQDEKKTFYPTPMSGLNRLTIAVRKPNGELYNESKDDYAVVGLQHDGLNPSYVMIVLDKYFDKNEFWKGDSIRIQGFKMDTSNTSGGVRRLSDFMNQPTGHVIAEMGQPNPSGYFKTFYVRAPGDFDAERGVDALDKDALQAIDQGGTVRGEIMNTTLQCVFSFKVETISADLAAEFANADLVTA